MNIKVGDVVSHNWKGSTLFSKIVEVDMGVLTAVNHEFMSPFSFNELSVIRVFRCIDKYDES